MYCTRVTVIKWARVNKPSELLYPMYNRLIRRMLFGDYELEAERELLVLTYIYGRYLRTTHVYIATIAKARAPPLKFRPLFFGSSYLLSSALR
jgi:hypothetical protein